MQRSLLILSLLLCLSVTAWAQVDSSTTPSSVKTLTLKQYSDYQNGPALTEMALPATMNRFPMPDDVLKLSKELKLTTAQLAKIKDISRYLQQKKVQTGQSVLRNEKKLDELFQSNKVDEGTIVFYGNRYGLYEGEYRTSVLLACYNTYNTLTPQQTSQFWQLQKR